MVGRPTILLAGFLGLIIVSACEDLAPETEHIQRANELRADGDVLGAVIELKNGLKNYPDHVESRLLLGQIYVDMGDGVSAEKELLRARSLGSSRYALMKPLAEAWLLQGKYEQVLQQVPVIDEDADAMRATALVLRGKSNLKLERFDTAKDLLYRALNLIPDSIGALVNLGRLALETKDLDGSEEFLARASEIAPNDTEVLMLKGDLAFLRGDFAASETIYQQAVKARPYFFVPLIGLARAELSSDKNEAAGNTLDSVLKTVPQNLYANYLRGVVAFLVDDYAPAITHVESTLQSAPDHMPSILVRGAARFALGGFEAARKDMERILAASPWHQIAGEMLRLAKLRIEKTGAAPLADVTTVEPNSEDIELLHLVGAAAIEIRSLESARKYLERIGLDALRGTETPTDPDGLQIISRDTEAAIGYMKNAIKGDPNLPQETLQRFTRSILARKSDQAIISAWRIQESFPENPVGLNLEAIAWLSAGDLKVATRLLNKALELRPGDTEASHLLAEIAVSEGRLDEARAFYRESLQHNTGDAQTLMRLSMLETRLGSAVAARAWLRQALDADPEAVQPRIMLAQEFLREGDTLQALDTIQQGLDLLPESEPLLELLAKAQTADNQP